jgi:hypothetical protein
MRRILVVLVLVGLAAVWPLAGMVRGVQATPAVTTASLLADFNNDGADDLAVGVPTESVGGISLAGAVNVLYGAAAGGLSGSGSQLFTQDSPGIAGGAEAGDDFGDAVASGDFDNDGFADLAVGVDLEDVGAIGDAGAVNVLYGSAGGLSGSGSQLFTQVAGAVEAGDRFGVALATGDFDNDGFADLAVGAPLEDVATAADAGAMSVLYGSAGGLSGSGGQLFTQVGGAVEAGDRFGVALATGDFDNDGFADLAVGAPLEDVGTAADAGAVSELRGSAGGLTTSGGQLHTERSFTGPQPGDQFGFALAAGDITPSGTDLVVGIPFEDITATRVDTGAVNVFFGTPQGLFATFEDQHQQPSNPERGDRFGAAVAVADFNNDGFGDVAAGAPLEDIGSTVDAGAVNALYGEIIGLSSETLTQDTPGVAGSAEAGDRFGAALAIGEPTP